VTIGQYSLLLYVLFWIVRINGCIRRGREPLLRGSEWFFDVRVPTGFYSGVGRRIVRRYRARMLIPFAADIPLAALIIASGHLGWLNALIVALSVLIHLNHSASVARAQREARAFAIPETEQPATEMALSLAPRRLRDYSNRAVETIIALGTAALFAWLLAYYLTASERPDARGLFAVPALMVYLQLGLLYIKALAVAWRSPLPRRGAEEYLEASEELRRHWVLLCDGSRLLVTASAFFWPTLLAAGADERARVMGAWFLVWIAAAVGGTAWAEIRRMRLASIVSRLRPVRLPHMACESPAPRGPLSFEPAMPTLVLRGVHGHSLNIANRWFYLAAGYAAGLVALFLLAAGDARAAQPMGIDRLRPCHAGEGPADGYCGSLPVFENRATGVGRKIALKIVVLPALRSDARGIPLFVLAGGPGQGAAEIAPTLQAILEAVEIGRDIVFVDLRGTGGSNPLRCKPRGGRFDHCLEEYRGRADLTQYTTQIAMDDLDDVRIFLGYPQIDLYGISYGTRAAMVYARRHRDHVGSVVLDAVMPPDMRLPLFMARDGQRALDLLFRDCELDIACGRRFPRLRERTRTVLENLAAQPRRARYVDPLTGTEKDEDIRRLRVAGILFTALYSPTASATVPLLVEQAESGNFTGFFALGASNRLSSESVAKGLQYSVICSEDATRIAPGSIAAESRGTFLGAELGEAFLEPCESWPRGRVPEAFFEDAPSDVPALILSGELDPVTPPSWGDEVTARWKNAKHIVFPAGGHGQLSPGSPAAGCAARLVAAFLDTRAASTVDASCAARLHRPPFFISPAGPSVKANG
jgi:pimeloyl-ACP methyl ester carboxylesterase